MRLDARVCTFSKKYITGHKYFHTLETSEKTYALTFHPQIQADPVTNKKHENTLVPSRQFEFSRNIPVLSPDQVDRLLFQETSSRSMYPKVYPGHIQ